MNELAKSIRLEDLAIQERAVRSAGARGQNARNDATAVELRLDLVASAFPPDMQARLIALAGRRIANSGELIVVSRAARSQAENRESARARLLSLLQEAAEAPAARRPTRPRKAAREERLDEKKRHAAIKRVRRS